MSVIIPTHNRVDYLRQTIESALRQDFNDFEVVVVDNASTDGTDALMQQYSSHPRVRYYRNAENIGMVASWRRAVFELAYGEWFMILSDDDYLIDQSYLRKAADLICSESSLMLVYADGYLLYEETGKQVLLDLPFSGVVSGEAVFASRGQVKPQDFTLCNILFRRDFAIRVDSFSNQSNLSCDTELFLLSCLHGTVGVVKGPATVYRIHATNLLKSARVNPRLCFGSLDSLVTPYLVAQQMGHPQSAASLRASSRMDREIVVTMLKVACLDYSYYKHARAALADRAPVLAREVMQTPMFRAAILLCRAFPWIYSAYIMLKRLRSSLLKMRLGKRSV